MSLNPLKKKIVEFILSEGPITFERFMEMALYSRGMGYYMGHSSPIGRVGDYYTGTHLHKIFGLMMAKQIEEMWHFMGRPKPFQIVEIGPGTGYLAKDMLEYLRVEGEKRRKEENLFDRLQYTIVEMNPSAKARQQQLYEEFVDRVTWSSSLVILDPFTGCVVSNELLDAFPVRLVEMDAELMEVYVSVKHGPSSECKGGAGNGPVESGEGGFTDEYDFTEVRMPCCREVRDYFEEFGVTLPAVYRTEVNLKIRDWIREVGSRLSEGFVLTIDYGYPAWEYYSEARRTGTLLCYHRHRTSENPYQHVGEQDITAHVNFSSLKKWGDETGLKTVGYCPQGIYLVSLGIDEVISELYGNPPDPFGVAQVKGLLLPQGMGESHKVMVHYKGPGEPDLKGFALRNQARRL
jgi:SAM-dependent MidA family methyltransferase